MTTSNEARVKELQAALETVREMKLAEPLQSVALEFLLRSDAGSAKATSSGARNDNSSSPTAHTQLREFIAELNPTTAVSQIPCLLYWARENEDRETFDEKSIVELFRRAGLRPPGNLRQSLRDLSSRKYNRIEAVSDQPGFVRLSVAGETFVLHDVRK